MTGSAPPRPRPSSAGRCFTGNIPPVLIARSRVHAPQARPPAPSSRRPPGGRAVPGGPRPGASAGRPGGRLPGPGMAGAGPGAPHRRVLAPRPPRSPRPATVRRAESAPPGSDDPGCRPARLREWIGASAPRPVLLSPTPGAEVLPRPRRLDPVPPLARRPSRPAARRRPSSGPPPSVPAGRTCGRCFTGNIPPTATPLRPARALLPYAAGSPGAGGPDRRVAVGAPRTSHHAGTSR